MYDILYNQLSYIYIHIDMDIDIDMYIYNISNYIHVQNNYTETCSLAMRLGSSPVESR